jgi:hypothetical protein
MTNQADPIDSHGAWKAYLVTRGSSELVQWAKKHGVSPCSHDYPFLHRITDVVSDGGAVRLLRCAKCAERYYLLPIDFDAAQPDVPGVPYELTGANLEIWVDSEKRHPAKGPIRWSDYIE